MNKQCLKHHDSSVYVSSQGKPRIMWSYSGTSFDNTPFEVVRKETRECQFGPHYFKKRERKSNRMYIQGTRKMGCCAHIKICEYRLYPEYALPAVEGKPLKSRQLRELRENNLHALKQALEAEKPVNYMSKYLVCLPTNEAHDTCHPTGVTVGPTQKMHPLISKKIEDLVRGGSTDSNEVQRALREYVKCEFSAFKPSPTDRSYYPTTSDIRNHMYKARMAMQLSKFDQENLAGKIEEWKKSNPDEFHFFRPYSETESVETMVGDILPEHKTTTLLWVHQQKWQRELMARYGNHISLIDATYRTMKYELPLFFVCVRTNVGYSVVAQFIVQSESVECISEALAVLKEWNSNWTPPYFLCDFSDAEFSALQQAFPSTIVYGCDFHREQAWTRWTQDRKNALDRKDADCLLDLLRACAWAPPGTGNSSVDTNYLQAVNLLKQSAVWKNNIHVQNWLTPKWLSHPQVCDYYLIMHFALDMHNLGNTMVVHVCIYMYSISSYFRDGLVPSELTQTMELKPKTRC